MAQKQNSQSSQYQKFQPYIAVIIARLCYAGFNIIVKLALDHGMSNYTLVVYGNAIAVPSTGIFALMFERKRRPKITFSVLVNVFILGLLGPVITQNFYYAGMKYTTSAFASTITNIVPAMAFLMAILSRMERIEIRKIGSQAKVAGTIVSVGGAILMTLYKGPIVLSMTHKHIGHAARGEGTIDKNWIKGSICLIVESVSFAACYVMQAMVVAKYPAPFSLTTLVSLVGCLQGVVATLIFERKSSVWKIGWDVTLFAVLYSGIIAFGICGYLQLLAMQKRGPVFVTAFSPLTTLIVAIMGLFILGEIIYVGGVVGAVLIVIGLYMVLWGKESDIKKPIQEEQSFHGPSPFNNNGNHSERNNADVELVKVDINGGP